MTKQRETGWRKVLFWSYPRGSWQYDILCALILAFIFLTPKHIFRGEFRNPDRDTVRQAAPASEQPRPRETGEKRNGEHPPTR
ncbi:MAG: hypothetical protein Kow00109_15500 [Acidobacteriota bacterium]